MKERNRLADYIKQHPKLTLAQAVASYLKLYPGRAVSIIVDCMSEDNARGKLKDERDPSKA